MDSSESQDGQPPRVVTIKDVARSAGVSVGTVSNVLRKLSSVKDRHRERVEEAITRLGYKPNMLAANLRQKRTGTIGLVIPDIRNTFFIEVADALEDLALADGFELIMAASKEDPERTLAHIRTLASRRVEGIFAIPAGDPDDAFQELAATGLPVVLVDRIEDHSPFPSVAVENHKAAELGTRHLIALGHRRIALVINSESLTNSRHRIEGFWAAARGAGIAAECQSLLVGMSATEAFEHVRALLAGPARPTALLTVSNLASIGSLRAVQDARLRVPDDVSILAFDDADFLSIAQPYVTAIRQPTLRIAEEAWRLLRQQMKDGRAENEHVRLDAEIVVRGSTCAPSTEGS